jgi:hypothetical protein
MQVFVEGPALQMQGPEIFIQGIEVDSLWLYAFLFPSRNPQNGVAVLGKHTPTAGA